MEQYVYSSRSSMSCNVFRPPEPAPNTCVVVVHGGAWVRGSKDCIKTECQLLSQKTNMITVIPNYSLSSLDRVTLNLLMFVQLVFFLMLTFAFRHRRILILLTLTLSFLVAQEINHSKMQSKRVRHPAHVQDIADCVLWCRDFLQAQTVHLVGHSAGAHLCALLATTHDRFVPSTMIQSCVLISGPLSYNVVKGSLIMRLWSSAIFERITSAFEVESCSVDDADCISRRISYFKELDAWPSTHAQESKVIHAKFLLLVSGVEMGLTEHSKHLHSILRARNVYSKCIKFSRTTHASIISGWDSYNKDVLDCISSFISSQISPRA